jgi:DNA (cytosine-5)-methyltransferase 1
LNYYNEIDPYAARWLEALIRHGHIAPGHVDTRSIEDVTANDLAGYTQCHFFAGIGVWSYALRLAGWPDNRPVWTGSCPCQPFSAAGKGGGTADERHLWPAWFHLIELCKPPVVFGEQVASPAGLGWFDTVHADLERAGYAIGAADLCAASVGAPHIRQRLYFVADNRGEGRRQIGADIGRGDKGSSAQGLEQRPLHGGAIELADAERGASERYGLKLGDPPREDKSREKEREWIRTDVGHGVVLGGLENTECAEGARFGQHGGTRLRQQEAERLTGSGCGRGWWGDADWLWCADQKYRPVEPGTFPLAHGAPACVGRLRAYGNAIVAPLAQAFIESYLDTV